MTGSPRRPGDSDTVRPSLMRNGFLALGCLLLAASFFGADSAKVEGALFMAIFLILTAAMIMAAHLPGCTGVWLDEDGFLTREMYKGERYSWSEVGPFKIRRRLLGTTVEFPYTPPGAPMPETRSLPRGMGRSAWRLMRFMNERRDRALAPAP